MSIRHKALSKIAPANTKRHRALKRLMWRLRQRTLASGVLSYAAWIDQVEPGLFSGSEVIRRTKLRPLISIIVPCYNTPQKYVDPLIDSVRSQLYENWELCLVDGSTDEVASDYLKSQAVADTRIRYIAAGENLGIVGNTNIGLKAARGEFIAFMDHDDMLSSHALSEVIAVLNEKPKTDLIYSDEDKLSDDGKQRLLPFFKPDWSPELLLGVNYITHFVVARKKLVDTIGGLRSGFDGAQDYDFLLRFTEKTDRIVHIPKMLYHWRLADGSTAKNVGEKSYADTAGQRALKDAIKRRKIKAEVVEIPERPTNYRLRYALPEKKPKISIIIPFKDKIEYLKKCLPSIFHSTYNNYEIILVSNNSEETATHKYLEKLKKDKRCKIYEWNHPFNYSVVNNFGRSKATGEYLVFLNNDTEVITADWIEELVGLAAQPDIGVVGPLLRYPDRRIQHAGVVLGMGGMAGHIFRLLQPEQWTDFGLPCWPRNYLSVTGACLVVKAAKFDEAGGFDEQLMIGGNDVALGISLHERGYRNVYWPFAEIIHYENVSVGPYTKSVPQGDYNRSLVYYGKYLDSGDPYFNPNLDLMNEQIALRSAI